MGRRSAAPAERHWSVAGCPAGGGLPGFLTDAEAATLPCAGVTAWNALTGGRPVRAGETVLTLGTGGVSLWAVQLAAAMGARVIATTGDDAKADLLTRLGASAVVNHRTAADWPAAVRELTGGRGADHVVEVAGTFAASVRAAAFGAQVGVIGFVGGSREPLDPVALFAGESPCARSPWAAGPSSSSSCAPSRCTGCAPRSTGASPCTRRPRRSPTTARARPSARSSSPSRTRKAGDDHGAALGQCPLDGCSAGRVRPRPGRSRSLGGRLRLPLLRDGPDPYQTRSDGSKGGAASRVNALVPGATVGRAST